MGRGRKVTTGRNRGGKKPAPVTAAAGGAPMPTLSRPA